MLIKQVVRAARLCVDNPGNCRLVLNQPPRVLVIVILMPFWRQLKYAFFHHSVRVWKSLRVDTAEMQSELKSDLTLKSLGKRARRRSKKKYFLFREGSSASSEVPGESMTGIYLLCDTFELPRGSCAACS